MKRLAILLTHPIQYYAPVFRLLQQGGIVHPLVFYTRPPDQTLYDSGFGQNVSWDIPLLEGYDYQFQAAGSKSQNQALIEAIAQWQPQAILVYGWNPPGHLAVMRHFKGKIPVWFRGDSTLLDEQPGPRQWLRRWFLRWVYRHVDLAFYVGAQNRRYFEAHGLKPQQLRFAPHAVDNDRFADGPEKNYESRALSWRRELGIADDDFVILFAGKLEPKKAPDLLLQAFQTLKTENDTLTHLHLIFAGSGRLETSLKQAAAHRTDVHFIGFQNQSMMPIVYRLGSVLCLPSQGPGETWGLAVNEAFACSRGVIISNKVGCGIDLALGNSFSCVFKANNLEDLKKSIRLMLSSYDINSGKRASHFIKDWSQATFVNLIQEILSHS